MPPGRVDGHHHMHLCANVQVQKLLPAGTIARRNFSFAPGEKGAVNRLYRRWQDRGLARRHRMTDFFFSLPPMDTPGRLEGICDLATRATVEVETHPVNRDEYRFPDGWGTHPPRAEVSGLREATQYERAGGNHGDGRSRKARGAGRPHCCLRVHLQAGGCCCGGCSMSEPAGDEWPLHVLGRDRR